MNRMTMKNHFLSVFTKKKNKFLSMFGLAEKPLKALTAHQWMLLSATVAKTYIKGQIRALLKNPTRCRILSYPQH